MAKINLIEKYQPLFTSDSRYYIISGGRGSSKSFSVTTYLILLSMEMGHTILFTRYTMSSAHISIIPEFLEKIELLGLQEHFEVNKTEIVNKLSGSKILFRGLKTSSGDATANLKSLQGVTTWITDEAEELVDESMFDKIDLSVRHQSLPNKIILILNPTTKEHWIYKRFFESNVVEPGSNIIKNNTTYIHTTYLDNIQHLSPSFIQQIELMKQRRPKKYEHTILGGWLSKAEGVIFSNWSIGEFKEVGVSVYGQDYGFSNDPTTLVQISIDKNNKKIYLKEHLYQPNLTTSDIARINKSVCGTSLIIGDSAEPRLLNELKGLGCNIEAAIKGPGSVNFGIAMLQDYDLIIDPESVNLIKELNNYVWLEKKSKTPCDAWNHCFVGNTLITTIDGDRPMREIKVGDMVLTSNGYKKVLKKFNNGVKKVNRYSLLFDTKRVLLDCTNNHKIKTKDGWKEIQKIKEKDILYQNKPSMVKPITYTKGSDTSVKVEKDYIELFGNTTMVKYQKDTIFTTSIITQLIMRLLIYSWLMVKNIYQNTLKKDLKIKNFLKSFTQRVLRQQKNGTRVKKVLNGIENKLLKVVSETGIWMRKSVFNVKRFLNQKPTTKLCVVTNVNQLVDEKVEWITKNENVSVVEVDSQLTNIKRNPIVQENVLMGVEVIDTWDEEVFDIMVEDTHEYFANGILVHNCLDAVRYGVSYQLENPHKGVYHIW